MSGDRRNQFRFTVSSGWPPDSGRYCAFLGTDNWDDFHFKTTFRLHVYDKKGLRHDFGQVKIARFGMGDEGRTVLQPTFTRLSNDFFSLGQDEGYYRKLALLDRQTRAAVANGLRDVVADGQRLERARNEQVMLVSLMRSVSMVAVEGEFRRLLAGCFEDESYDFSFILHGDAGGSELAFEVIPASEPPTNVHVIVGRNGCGKTYILNGMADAILAPPEEGTPHGRFVPPEGSGVTGFAGVVLVSFSAFDEFKLRDEMESLSRGLRYKYVGLRSPEDETDEPQGDLSDQLTRQFVESFGQCQVGARRDRWLNAMEVLESDIGFRQLRLPRLLAGDLAVSDEPQQHVRELFRPLSSGHKIVLLTLTRLVETVQERTLVLLDEPECHLHPPLLSAFVRALSHLLSEQNGVAIIATHSPVVLQEVPASCVLKLIRSGGVTSVDHPELETFGENTGVLTREVFGLDVTKSGFHWLVDRIAESSGSTAEVKSRLDGQLGSEARAIVHGLMATRRRAHGDES